MEMAIENQQALYLNSATLLDFAPKKQLENWGYVKVLPKLASLSKFVFNKENKCLMKSNVILMKIVLTFY